ncbi:glucosamine-6-phosphate deaminase [Verrucomicrobia bacterium]|nr:glucosamine-6-phosphate deaminase [Verrucomicrobiota bacterium]
MNIHRFDTKDAMGKAAAEAGAAAYRAHTENENGHGAIVVATGASQFETLDHLTREELPWPKITGFHIDEYVGLSIEHAASFRQYLWRRFVSKLPYPMKAFNYINGELNDPTEECRRLGRLIEKNDVAVAFVGIGENAHIGFNDPPADFGSDEKCLVVDLDQCCRQQQVGEGWFEGLDNVPTRAITMTVKQLMKSRTIICTVPDERKAEALRNALEGPVTPEVPASILQNHPDCHFFVDHPAASLLEV